jgi:hypothetical protein
MAEPTPDEAAASLRAVLDVLDQGGRHCGCDPELYGDTDFIGSVSDAQGRGHREVHASAIRAVLADRFAMLDLIAEFVAMDGQECDVDHAGDCRPHGYPTVEAGAPCPYRQARDLLAANKDALDARQRQRSAHVRAQLESMLDEAERTRRG